LTERYFITCDAKDLFSGIKRTLGVGGDCASREFTGDELAAVLAHIKAHYSVQVQCFFQVLVDFWLRGSDAIPLTAGSFRTFTHQDRAFTQLLLRFGKMDPLAAGQSCVKLHRPSDDLYLNYAATIPEPTPIFNPSLANPENTLRGYRAILRETLAALHIDTLGHGLHSFRRTGATMASRAGVPDRFIRVFGRWKSFCFARYTVITAEQAAEAIGAD
jgi:hypothetical protein